MSEIVLSKYQQAILDGFKNTKDNMLINALAGCVDCDTEYFNGIEWVRIADYKEGDKVLSYNIDTKEAFLDYPKLYHKYPCEHLWHFETKYGLDQCLSDEHRMLCYTYQSAKKLSFINFLDFKQKHENNKCGYYGQFETTFNYSGNRIDLTDQEIRLMVAVIADGSFYYQAKNDWDSYDRCRFHIKKDRKKERLRKLLKEAGYQWEEKVSSAEGYIDFYIDAPRREKVFTKDYWYNCDQHQLQVIFDEVWYWDGDFLNANSKTKKRFFTNIKETADFIQFVCSSCGYRATIQEYNRIGKSHITDNKIYEYKTMEYCVIATQRHKIGMSRRTDLGKEKVQIQPYKTKDGYKYCFTMPLGTLILRRNNKIFITGNSGKTFLLVELSKLISTYSVFVAFNKSIQEELKTKITNPKFKVYTLNGLGYLIMNHNWDKMEEERLKTSNKKNDKKRGLQLNQYKTLQMIPQIIEPYKHQFKGIETSDEEDIEEIYFEEIAQLFDLCRQRMVNVNDRDDVLDTIDFYELFHNIHIPENICDILNDLMLLDMKMFKNDGIIDFIDQIFLTFIFVRSGEWQLEYYHKFENILADEAQDLSKLQQLFLGLLRRSKTSRIIAVGDNFQAIYGFSGADCRAMDNIRRLYKPIEYDLPINYRCPAKHLRYVNREFQIPIQPRPNAPEGKLYTIEYDDLENNIRQGDCILARKNSDLCSVALELLSKGFSIYIRDENLVNKLLKQIKKAKKELQDLTELPLYISNIRANQMQLLQERSQNFHQNGIIDNTEIDKLTFTDTNIDLLDCLEVLYNNYYEDNKDKINKLKDFNAFALYVQEKLQTKGTRNSIQCVSIHQAKGKEYNRVFILNKARVYTEFGRNSDQRQQESNLSYIALTRSKDTIYLVKSKSNEEEYTSEDFF